MVKGDSRAEERPDTGRAPKSKTEAAADKVSRHIVMGDPTYVGPNRKTAFGNQLDSDDGNRHFVGPKQAKRLRRNAADSRTSVVKATRLRESLKKQWGEEVMKASGVVDYDNAIDSVTRNAEVAEAHAGKRFKLSHGDSGKMVDQFEKGRRDLEAKTAVVQEMSEDLRRVMGIRRNIFGENPSPQAVIEALIEEQRAVIQVYGAAFEGSTRQDITSTFESAQKLFGRDELLQVKKTFRDFMKQDPAKLALELRNLVNSAVHASEVVANFIPEYKDYMIEGITRNILDNITGQHFTQRTKAQNLLDLGTQEELDQKITVFEELGLVNNALRSINRQLAGKIASKRLFEEVNPTVPGSSREAKMLEDSMTSIVEATRLRDSLKKQWGEEAMRASGVVDYDEAIDRVTRKVGMAKAYYAKGGFKRSHADLEKVFDQFVEDCRDLEAKTAVVQEMSEDLSRLGRMNRDVFEGGSSPQEVIEGLIREQRAVIQLYGAAFRGSTQQDITSTLESARELLKRDNTYDELLQAKKTFRGFMKQNPAKLALELRNLVNSAVHASEVAARSTPGYKDYTIVGITRKILDNITDEHYAQRTKAQELLGLGTQEELDQKITVFEALGLVNNALHSVNRQLAR